jgi:hypothetical protein
MAGMLRCAIALALAACAHDVHTQYSLAPPPGSGAVEVVLNRPSSQLTVTVDGHLVATNAHSRRVRVDGVPSGDAAVRVASGGGCEQGQTSDVVAAVAPGQVSTIVLPGPEPSMGCSIMNGLFLLTIGVEAVALAVDERMFGPGRVVR